ncbi:MAG: exodeoxyribonuclease V subunit gamma [Oceanospirillaceae bacterium]|nr:exodeoxyribonuclease V subunit gamma [Oceanospirillaceae bacterium]
MLKIYHSHSLLNLKDLLVLLIERDPLPDPFRDEQILVQSPGMAQWLKLELASGLGIAAGVEFPLPATFLWDSFARLLPDVPERSAYRKEAMCWKLMGLLPDMLALPEFAPLRHYLEQDETGFKRYQLCGKIADIFDQYLVYRPDWIDAWSRSESPLQPLGDQAWQPLLWRALQQRTEALGQPGWHRANMMEAFVESLRSAPADCLPTRLFVFGISALPHTYLQALQALGRRVDVHLMILNPCRHYWGDIVDPAYLAKLNRRLFGERGPEAAADYLESGNPLLASMGKLGRDYLHQLQEMDLPGFDFFDLPGDTSGENDTLLGRIQRDILELEDRSREPEGADHSGWKTPLADTDRSLQLHSCHSPLRELEVLHDRLLALFESAPGLTPRDIIVMMPDVAAYAPHIEAVFGSAPAERRIAYSISDRSLEQESPLLQGFLTLLQLPHSRLRVADVLDLLEIPATLRRFGLDEAAFELLRGWIEQAGVRWGLDAGQRESLGLPAFEQNSWRFGLRRMLAGFALGDCDGLWQDLAPYSEVEGLEAVLLGALADFIDLLEEAGALFRGERSVADWVVEINALLSRCYAPDEQDELALSQVRRALENLALELSDAGRDEPLHAEILVDYLTQALSGELSGQRFMIGALNFCTLMPMRSIPFRVVCLLGMNDGVYPRTLPPMGFDLIARHPRRGDRSRRDDDRYLFLEALLSAREQLYISFVGRSIQDNRERVPSVLVSELLEYCAQGFVLPGDETLAPDDSARNLRSRLVVEHPLTAYSERYFDDSSAELFSYAQQWLPAAGAGAAEAPPFCAAPLAPETVSALELDELLAFFRNPCRHFFLRRLRVGFRDLAADALDEEPFVLDNLESYGLRSRILAAQLDGRASRALAERLRAEGGLPVGTAGDRLYRQLSDEVAPLAQALEPLMQHPARRAEIDLQIDGLRLTGWIDGVRDDRLLRYRPASLKGRDHFLGWIEHLAGCASAGTLGLHLYGVERRKGVQQARFRALQPDAAQAELARLLQAYREGLSEPLPFAPNSAWAWLRQPDPDRALRDAEGVFSSGYNQPGEGDDPYIARVYGDFDSIRERMLALTESLFAPLLDHLETEKRP